jgi:large subunit ribosomal protein L25
MNDKILKLEKRSQVGGGKPKKLRRNGYIPAVVYGQGMSPSSVQVKLPDMREFLARHGRNSVFTAEFAEEHDFSALIKDIQYDPVRKDIVHVDFQKISLTEKVQVEVPVKVTGKKDMEKSGNVVAHQLNEITVECLPQDVPKNVEANIAGMTPGSNLTAAQLKLPQGVALVTDPRSIILTITGGGR